ncbi:FkbM family methyltransferase [Aerosakkonemataceae cyanobacterium BLCC-F154]|uniref:FkbM family methyltransferase n=1 Tax=Floridaenema fluviatile BLCC-F154 TaxID=3153640 RepID=A0ABV4Y9F1_9CYAN
MKTIENMKYLKNILFRSGFHYFRMSMAQPPYWIAANGKSCQIFAGDYLGSATCYREIIIDDFYQIFNYAKHFKPSLIVDIGANIGIFSKLCSLLFPDANIYAYEPNPTALTWLEKNAKLTHIKVCPYAVGIQDELVFLDSRSDSTTGKISQGGNIPVQCIALTKVAQGQPIDLLKMDCEGSEWTILQNPELLKRTQSFCMEYHLFDQHTLEELQNLIEKADHRIVSITPQFDWDSQVGCLWSTHK